MRSSLSYRWLVILAVPACVSDSAPAQDASVPDTAFIDTGTAQDANVQDALSDGGMDADLSIKHIYVANFNNGKEGGVSVYDLPLDGSAAPVIMLGSGNGLLAPTAVRVDPNSTRIWVVDRGGNKVAAFNLPVTASSTPVVTIPLAFAPEDAAFDSTGNLWACGYDTSGGGGRVAKLAAPLGSSTVPAFVLITPVGNAFGMAIDPMNNMYVSGYNSGGFHFYANPVTMASGPAYSNKTTVAAPLGFVLNSGKLYVADFNGKRVAVFTLPTNANSVPTSFVGNFDGGIDNPFRMTFDQNANLVVADGNDVVALKPPTFSSVAYRISVGTADARGVVFGP